MTGFTAGRRGGQIRQTAGSLNDTYTTTYRVRLLVSVEPTQRHCRPSVSANLTPRRRQDLEASGSNPAPVPLFRLGFMEEVVPAVFMTR